MELRTTSLSDLIDAKGERRQKLPDALKLGAAHLRVQDLGRALAFYVDVIGLQIRERTDDQARLWAGDKDVIVLHQTATGRQPRRHSGLYHVALLFPNRLELARVVQRIAEARALVEGASDHGTHEAFYLPDPDGNGLELAADRPRSEWPQLTDVTKIAPRPLDVGGLFNLTSGHEPVSHAEEGLAVGHVHLHIGDLEAAVAFYRELIGFDLVTFLDSAAFLSAGGYHHHLAINIWEGASAPPAPSTAAGLKYWTVELPSARDVESVGSRLLGAGVEMDRVAGGFEACDPSGNRVRVVAGEQPKN